MQDRDERFKELLKRAFSESLSGQRKGDKVEETQILRDKVSELPILVATSNEDKFRFFKNSLSIFQLKANWLKIDTSFADLTPMPVISKINYAKNFVSNALIISRGRVGLPGSGAATVLADDKGRIISMVTSPPSHIHRLPMSLSIYKETFELLLRLGFTPKHRGITDKTKTVYSNLKILDVFRKVSERKFQALKPLRGKSVLIIGGYLDGAFLCELLKENFDEIHVIDLESEVITFVKSVCKDVKSSKSGRFDLVLDLTGFGGIDSVPVSYGLLITESPSGRLKLDKKEKGRILRLRNEYANTSGTMSLSLKVIRVSADKIEKIKGVLYAVPNLANMEELLFSLKSAESFLSIAHLPALSASVLGEQFEPELLDRVIDEEVKKIEFELL